MRYIQTQRRLRRCRRRRVHHCLLHLAHQRHLHNRHYADTTKERKATTHAFTSASAACSPAVSRYIQPSRSSIVRVPYAAFASECVTCTIVVPCSFSFRNNSIISLACSECRF